MILACLSRTVGDKARGCAFTSTCAAVLGFITVRYRKTTTSTYLGSSASLSSSRG